MSLTREQVEKVSLLARLRLSGDELDTMTAQLGQIVEYVDQLGELDTSEVEPMAHYRKKRPRFRIACLAGPSRGIAPTYPVCYPFE